jgi:hypothetical protein
MGNLYESLQTKRRNKKRIKHALNTINEGRITGSSNVSLSTERINGRYVLYVDFVYNSMDEIEITDTECIYEASYTSDNKKAADKLCKKLSKKYHVQVLNEANAI